MNSKAQWSKTYSQGGQDIRWPWSDVVGLTVRHARPREDYERILELGFGSGANIPFFLERGCEYHGIEACENIVDSVRRRFPTVAGALACADFTKEIPFAPPFDLVVDRAALTHNTREAMREGIGLARSALRPGGLFIGVDWFSTAHSELQRGRPTDEPFTRQDYAEGIFQGLGVVHFCDERVLRELFTGFRFVALEHKTTQQMLPNDSLICVWNFVVQKS
jgi:SAM-dependent methyltransferase